MKYKLSIRISLIDGRWKYVRLVRILCKMFALYDKWIALKKKGLRFCYIFIVQKNGLFTFQKQVFTYFPPVCTVHMSSSLKEIETIRENLSHFNMHNDILTFDFMDWIVSVSQSVMLDQWLACEMRNATKFASLIW